MTPVAPASSAQTIEQFRRFVVGNYTRYPVCLVRGEGSHVWDAEGNRYLDFFPGWGCCLLGHCPPRVVEAVREQVATGVIPSKTGYEIAKLKGEDKQEEMARRVVAEKLTAADTAKAVRQKKGRAAAKRRGGEQTFRLDRGFKVVVTATRSLSREDVISALEQALEQAKASA